MINGFEEETHELTEAELAIVPVIVSKIKFNFGVERAATNKMILDYLKKEGYKVNPARIRKAIHYIRTQGLVEDLISTNKGYFVARRKEEVINYVESLQQRINSIEEVKNSFDL